MKKKSLTEKQKKLIKLFSENIGDNKKPKSIKQMMLEAGYSESSSNQQTASLEGVKEKMKPIVEKLEEEREKIFIAMKNKRNKANYSDLVRGLDITTKNIQLLGGKPTENVKIYSWEKYEDNIVSPENMDEETPRG